jgi:hypothetical protein
MQFKKEFNSSGPNRPDRHYTLSRPDLMQKGSELVYNDRYFTIFAPRQSGKSTFFQMLGEQLKTEGYKVCYSNFENGHNTSQASFLESIATDMRKAWGISVDSTDFTTLTMSIQSINTEKFVLVVDEVEGINTEYLDVFLHTIRSIYHTRDTHAVKSVILVGVKNITGVMKNAVSPFNINEELEVPYFTEKEINELLTMHETESARLGKPQIFSAKVRERICYMTAGQPGLVNGFAGSLVQLFPDVSVFEFEHYLRIETNYTAIKINKNVSNIVEKARKHQKYVEKLLFDDSTQAFMIQDERVKELSVNGIIAPDEDYNIIFPVPLYRKCLHAAFSPIMNGESFTISKNIDLDLYFTADGLLIIDKIIRDYQTYAKLRGFRYFITYDTDGKPKGLREAALMYSFETYIQSFLKVVKGKSYLEPHVALGRSDLLVNIRGTEFVIEGKLYHNITQFKDGKPQLAYYIKSLGLKDGVYLVFVANDVTHKNVVEAVDIYDDVTITTYLVRYDIDTDFG